jgi:peptide/nickel transport system substrate-binding protein
MAALDLQQVRLSRRRALAAGALGVSWLLAAPRVGLAQTPRTGGVLHAGQIGDPIFNAGAPINLNINNAYLKYTVLEQLIRYRTSLEPELVLVDRFEYNADHTGLVAQLKPDLIFHNGAPVTPADVFFCVEMAANPDKYGPTGPNLVTFARAITDMKALDDRTMQFTFDRARMNMSDFFAYLSIAPAAAYDKVRAGAELPGTGPYRFVSWKPKESIQLAANPNWHATAQEGGPYLDGIDIKLFADDDAMGLALQSGELDLIMYAAPQLAALYKGTPQLQVPPKAGVIYLGLVVDNPLLADPRVRQAIFLAIDRARMVDELQEGLVGGVTSQPWPSTSPAFDPTLEAPLYDPERARGLLSQAGFSQQAPLLLEIYQGVADVAAVIQQNLAAIGMSVEIRQLDNPTSQTKLLNRQYTDLFLNAHVLANVTPVTLLQLAVAYEIPNPMHYASPDYADLIATLDGLDPTSDAARAQYARFNQLFVQDPWLVPLYPNTNLDVTSARVQGLDEFFMALPAAPNFGKVSLKA